MRIVEIVAGEPYPSLFLVGPHTAAVLARGVLRVVDLGGAAEQVIEGVVAWAAAAEAIVTLHAGGGLTCWERGPNGFRPTARCDLAAPDRASLTVSASGRFVVVDAPHAQVVDLAQNRVVATLEARLGTVRPAFDRFPDGREVLFAACPGYMSVTVLDLERGAPIAAYTERTSWDFCHTDFRLAAGGDLLVTFGCVWAAPYEARIYDARSWTRGGPRGEGGAPRGLGGAPLPLVRAIEPIASNTLLGTHVGPDGALTSACLETRADLAPDEDGDLPSNLERLGREEPMIASRLAALPGEAEAALIVRVLDPMTAATLRAGVWGVPVLREQNLHYLDGHRMVAVGREILVLDPIADRLTRHGAVQVAAGDTTAVSRDGEVVVIARA